MQDKKIVHIDKPYVTTDGNGMTRLCADVTIGDRTSCLWYAVEDRYASALTKDRSDPFAVALTRIAMQLGADIVCEAPVSRKLLYKLNQSFIPALAFAYSNLKEVKIIAEPVVAVSSGEAVGCSCSFGVDSLYSVIENSEGEYPVTHLCIFNAGTFEDDADRKNFHSHYRYLQSYAKERGLDSICVDTNLHEALNERYLDFNSARLLSVMLALQGMFRAYHYSSTVCDEDFCFDDFDDAYYDPLIVDCLSTESLTFFLSGASVSRIDELKVIAEHPDEAARIHPCFRRQAWEKNCQKCLKCRRDMLSIYAAGMTDKFSKAFDFTGFEKKIPVNLAFAMTEEYRDALMKEAIQYWKDQGLEIPQKAYVYAEKFKTSVDNLERTRGGKCACGQQMSRIL